MLTAPKIGVPRIYPGHVIPVLYPGEIARATITFKVDRLRDGVTDLPVENWLVEPMPGVFGWWLRVRYRIWGRWCSREAPILEAELLPRGTTPPSVGEP